MNIRISENRDIGQDHLEELFLSVDWESGKHPDKLRQGMLNSHRVCTAWDGDMLVGLVNAVSDNVTTAYFQYVLVRPEYQSCGVGRLLMQAMLDGYDHVLHKVLVSYDDAAGFYENLGFARGDGKHPMFISRV